MDIVDQLEAQSGTVHSAAYEVIREAKEEIERLRVIQPIMDARMQTLIKQLIEVGTGNLRHLYRGQCPDPVSGHQTRDDECPACQVLAEADLLVQPKVVSGLLYQVLK